MEGVRPQWWPRAAGLSFLETNVRTYVSYGGRPGVYFLSLDAAHWIAVQTARRFWGLPYHYARMSSRADQSRCVSDAGAAAAVAAAAALGAAPQGLPLNSLVGLEKEGN